VAPPVVQHSMQIRGGKDPCAQVASLKFHPVGEHSAAAPVSSRCARRAQDHALRHPVAGRRQTGRVVPSALLSRMHSVNAPGAESTGCVDPQRRFAFHG